MVRSKGFRRIVLWVLGSVIAVLVLASALVYFNQDKIKQIFIQELNKSLVTEVGVKDIQIGFWSSFPSVSVSFNNVSIAEAYADTTLKRDTLASLETLGLEFNLMDILFGRYQIRKIEAENGFVRLRILPSGDCNYLFWKTDTTKTSPNFAFSINSITLEDIALEYHNDISRLFFASEVDYAKAKGDFSAQKQQLSLSTDLMLRRFAYDKLQMKSNIPLSADIEVSNDRMAQLASINPSSIEVGEMSFRAEGDYRYKEKNNINCRIEGEEIKLSEALSLFTQDGKALFEDYKAKGLFNFAMSLKGEVSASRVPAVSATFDLRNASLSNKKADINFSSLNLKGSYTNGEKRNSETSALVIDDFATTFTYGFAKGMFSLRNFNKLYIDAKLNAKGQISKIQEVLKIKEIDTLSGMADIDLVAQGSLKQPKLNGKVSIKDLNLSLSQVKNHTLSKADCSLRFDNDRVIVEQLDGRLNDKAVKFTGEYNFAGNLRADLQLAQYKLNDIILDNIKASFTYRNKVIDCSKLDFEAFDGKIKSNKCRIQLKDTCTLANGLAQLEQINLKKAFAQTKNLNQNLLTDKNIKGLLSANAQFTLYFDKDFNLILERSSINTDYNLSKGELSGVELLKKLSLFVEEDALNNVKFAPITSSLQLNGGFFSLNPIKIQSNAINFDLVGKQHLDGRIDYSIAIKLSELASKKRKARLQKEQEEFGAFETGKDNRITLFVKIKGTIDNPIFSFETKGSLQKAKEQLQQDKKDILRSIDKDFNLRIEERKQDKEQWKRQEAGEFIIEWGEETDAKSKKQEEQVEEGDLIIEW